MLVKRINQLFNNYKKWIKINKKEIVFKCLNCLSLKYSNKWNRQMEETSFKEILNKLTKARFKIF